MRKSNPARLKRGRHVVHFEVTVDEDLAAEVERLAAEIPQVAREMLEDILQTAADQAAGRLRNAGRAARERREADARRERASALRAELEALEGEENSGPDEDLAADGFTDLQKAVRDEIRSDPALAQRFGGRIETERRVDDD